MAGAEFQDGGQTLHIQSTWREIPESLKPLLGMGSREGEKIIVQTRKMLSNRLGVLAALLAEAARRRAEIKGVQ